MLRRIFIFFLVAGLVACQKKSGSEDAVLAEKPYTFSNGILKFKSIQAYQDFLETGSEKQKLSLIKDAASKTGYEPLYKSEKLKALAATSTTSSIRSKAGNEVDSKEQVKDLLTVSLLSSMVNSRGLIEIGNYIFNLDLLNGYCYAMHTSWLSETNANKLFKLIEQPDASSDYVLQFSTATEVLPVLQSANEPKTKTQLQSIEPSIAFCGEDGQPHLVSRGTEYYPNFDPNYRDQLECKVAYDKAGVYFALYGRIDISPAPNWQSRRDWFYWRFKPKCWNERYQPYTTDYAANQANGSKRFAWESTRALHKYDISFQWEILGHSRTSNTLLKTQVYGIKAGY